MKRFIAAMTAASVLAAFVPFAVAADGPAFTLKSAAGGTVSLGQFAGKKPVLLVFWATWCPHCNEAAPSINDMHMRLSGRLEILAVDFMESAEKVKGFIRKKNVSYTVLLDRDGKVARLYGVRGIPTYVLLDRNGRIVYFDNELPPDIERRI
ncbi:MAG: TlpA family protein disulfide reductase [Deltaproteobacteria bacterium]|nr:TlpA family protein disulfide reductase [Deltaproteobacteria bacterium]